MVLSGADGGSRNPFGHIGPFTIFWGKEMSPFVRGAPQSASAGSAQPLRQSGYALAAIGGSCFLLAISYFDLTYLKLDSLSPFYAMPVFLVAFGCDRIATAIAAATALTVGFIDLRAVAEFQTKLLTLVDGNLLLLFVGIACLMGRRMGRQSATADTSPVLQALDGTRSGPKGRRSKGDEPRFRDANGSGETPPAETRTGRTFDEDRKDVTHFTLQQLERAVTSTFDGLWEWNLETQQAWYAPRFRELLGYHPNDPFPECTAGLQRNLHPDDEARVLDAFEKLIGKRRPVDMECRLQTKSGRWNWFRLRATTVRDSDGTATFLTGAIQDLSEVKQASQSLVESDELMRTLLNQLDQGIYGVDRHGDCTFCNPAALRMLGFASPTQVLGKNMHDLIHVSAGHVDTDPACDICRTLETGEEVSSRHEVFWKTDGTTFPVEYQSNSLIREGKFVGAVVIFCDTTEKLASEQKYQEQEGRLRQCQRMESIGQLAGGVAHEYNNLLQVISGFIRFAQQSLPQGTSSQEDLDRALAASDRAAVLTRQLLNFSRRDTIRPVAVAAKEVLSELDSIIRPCMPESVDVHVKETDGDPKVHADPHLLQQVLMNLCVNARDAMQSSGEIKVAAEKVHVGEENPDPALDVPPGDYVRFSVSDTGSGIPDEVRDHLFDPFFTTKEVGKGTGMGLAMVFGVVDQHRGCVQVESRVGEGSTFHVYLPLCEDKVPRTASASPSDAPKGAGETILIAEDEPMVREVTTRVLQGAGYRTLIAENGAEAIELYHQHADEIDLLLFDVVMPKVSGKDAAATIRLLRPDIAVAFSSGYGDLSEIKSEYDLTGNIVIEKPYQEAELLRQVRHALDGDVGAFDFPQPTNSLVNLG